MKLILKQVGGLAPVARAPLTLDTADLREGRAEVEALARAVAAQRHSPASPHPDEIGYILTIVEDSATTQVRGTDTEASPEFGALVQHVKSGCTARGC